MASESEGGRGVRLGVGARAMKEGDAGASTDVSGIAKTTRSRQTWRGTADQAVDAGPGLTLLCRDST
jgi:hypothetical protein